MSFDDFIENLIAYFFAGVLIVVCFVCVLHLPEFIGLVVAILKGLAQWLFHYV